MRMLFRFILATFSVVMLLSMTLTAQDAGNEPPKKQKSHDFLDRIDFGGNFGLGFGDVTYIEVSPLASYRITEKFHAGLGLTYIFYKLKISNAPDYSTSYYGGSIFTRYFIWRDLFAHVEYAPLYVNYDYNGVKDATWVHDILVGGGYRQSIGGKASVNLMLLWNINESYYSPYSNPIIRIGFGVGL